MNVLLIGGGGREHALAHALVRSPDLRRLFVLPGNAGTERLAVNVPGSPTDVDLALEVARREEIDLTVVGPEAPLAAGIVDAFERAGRRIFGPTAAGARIESDKAHAKALMTRHAIPTAEARVFERYDLAREYIATRDTALVVKAAGLAAGKGVIVCDEPSDAILAADSMLCDHAFGAAGERILVEERLQGREASVLALIDGRTIYMLESAQDHKRLLDGDQGPNTGGMGAFSPSTVLDEATLRQVEANIFVPIVDAILREGVRYRGVLYAGLMLTAGGPKVLEFNCRFGDPEAQALLLRLRSDLLSTLSLTADGRLDEAEIRWDPRASLCVVMASRGYPNEYKTGYPIRGLPDKDRDDLAVFHAGTQSRHRRLVTAGGRVLGVTALGDGLADARRVAYEAVERIQFEGAHYRRDLAASP
jgi:phosphoribosylamine--glycine ligase